MARHTVASLVTATLFASQAAATVTADLLAPRDTTCVSYGVDFQNGGSYFQNISSSDDFTFVSLFEGCQVDVANNILVDPTGDEYQCTDTNLTPDDENQVSTCPLEKNQLYTGEWSVVIISNNGDADPIAYERDLYLSVGVPSTTTYTPVLTLFATTTPIVNSTTTSTTTLTDTYLSTTTVPSRTYSPTITSTPKRVTTTVTKTIGTITKTKRAVVASVITKTKTASCSIPPKQSKPDPTCKITPTLVTAAALQTDKAKAKFRRTPDAKIVPADRAQRIAERKAALAERGVEKRSPDTATTTITDLNSLDWPTSTSTSIAPASTMVITTQAMTTVTATSILTVQSGKSTLPIVTVTAPTPTLTRTKYTVFTTTAATTTRTQTVTVTTTSTNKASASICSIKGGQMK